MTKTMTRTMVAALALSLSAGAFAGVKDKKAKRASDETVTKTVTKTISACGNKELKVEIVWADYDKFVADPKTVKEMGSDQKNWVFAKAGKRAEATLKALSSLCADKDYKEEIAKLKSIKFHPAAGYKTGKTAFTLSKDSASIKVVAGHYFSRSTADFKRQIKKLY